jgi:hypothetical protein
MRNKPQSLQAIFKNIVTSVLKIPSPFYYASKRTSVPKLLSKREKWESSEVFGTSNPYQPSSLQIYGNSFGKILSVLNDGENEVIEAFNQYVARVTDALKKAQAPDRVIHFSNNLFTLVRNY